VIEGFVFTCSAGRVLVEAGIDIDVIGVAAGSEAGSLLVTIWRGGAVVIAAIVFTEGLDVEAEDDAVTGAGDLDLRPKDKGDLFFLCVGAGAGGPVGTTI
jgi:hypothetical protein